MQSTVIEDQIAAERDRADKAAVRAEVCQIRPPYWYEQNLGQGERVTHGSEQQTMKDNMTAKGEAVREALDALFSDTSVEKQVTLDDLSEIQSDVETKVEALEADIKAGKAK